MTEGMEGGSLCIFNYVEKNYLDIITKFYV